MIKSLTFVNTLFHALQVSHLRLGHPKAVWQPLQPTSRHRGARAQNRARLHKGLQRRPIWDDEAALDVPELCGGARDDEVKEHWGRPRDVALTILQPAGRKEESEGHWACCNLPAAAQGPQPHASKQRAVSQHLWHWSALFRRSRRGRSEARLLGRQLAEAEQPALTGM